MTETEIKEAFARFLKTVDPADLKKITGFVPDEATLARESAFSKWQQLQNATQHCAMLGGAARADGLKAWHKLMGEWTTLMNELDSHPVEEPKQAVDVKAPNA